jgi:coenzyme F420-0:L-glutamate ligase/coenzyme F420-1:gamma-L-glutamate ligase
MNLDIRPIHSIPEVHPGMDLGTLLLQALRDSGMEVQADDIVAVTQKVISKAEGRVVRLSAVEPSADAHAISRQSGKDARLVEVILRESRRIVRIRGDVLICETHHGFICANAGVDRSNIDGGDAVSLLPRDPDRSARHLAHVLGCGVIVTDTFGRPWREGLLDLAIGVARVPAFLDYRGQNDTQGYPLQATMLAAVDALAAAAGLAMGKTTQTPAAHIRGYIWEPEATTIQNLLRPYGKDLFL